MTIVNIAILAVVQGAAELLPVSSSAHVILAARQLDVNLKSSAFHFLMAMLHTGTMGAVILFFFKRWKALLSGPKDRRNAFIINSLIATAATGIVGLGLKYGIEKYMLNGRPIEDLFANLQLIGTALLIVGVFIIFSARQERITAKMGLSYSGSFIVGFMQGICIPFRGFSRSGATISMGMILGFPKELAEEFSFALGVILTPAVIAREAWRLYKDTHAAAGTATATATATGEHFTLNFAVFAPGLVGMVLSFVSGLIALRVLANWMEKGRWSYFGYYCLVMAGVFFYLGAQSGV